MRTDAPPERVARSALFRTYKPSQSISLTAARLTTSTPSADWRCGAIVWESLSAASRPTNGP
jgi:hypothetical protein